MLLGFASGVNHDDRQLPARLREFASPSQLHRVARRHLQPGSRGCYTTSLTGSVMRVCSISMTADMSRNKADTQAGSKNDPLCART